MKPIKITENLMNELRQQFEEFMKTAKLHDGNIEFKAKFASSDARTKLYLTPTAYIKMIELVRHFSSEVGWQGIAERTDDDAYLVKDILVYPQQVTGVKVDTDQAEYEKWLDELDDYTFSHLRFHGHSHVNMGVNPSTTDMDNRRDKLLECNKDDFYIFAILNKNDDWTISIYDLKKNALFEDKDIDLIITGTADDTFTFAKDNASKVKQKTTTYQTPYTQKNYNPPKHLVNDYEDDLYNDLSPYGSYNRYGY